MALLHINSSRHVRYLIWSFLTPSFIFYKVPHYCNAFSSTCCLQLQSCHLVVPREALQSLWSSPGDSVGCHLPACSQPLFCLTSAISCAAGPFGFSRWIRIPFSLNPLLPCLRCCTLPACCCTLPACCCTHVVWQEAVFPLPQRSPYWCLRLSLCQSFCGLIMFKMCPPVTTEYPRLLPCSEEHRSLLWNSWTQTNHWLRLHYSGLRALWHCCILSFTSSWGTSSF